MDSATVWVKDVDVALFLGGNPDKGEAPLITVKLEKPQVLIDWKKKTITITETK